jgi:hypothetical protein
VLAISLTPDLTKAITPNRSASECESDCATSSQHEHNALSTLRSRSRCAVKSAPGFALPADGLGSPHRLIEKETMKGIGLIEKTNSDRGKLVVEIGLLRPRDWTVLDG